MSYNSSTNNWKPKKSLRQSQAETLTEIDKIFSPDLRVKIDKDCVIIGTEAVTFAGTNFLLKNAILEEFYDEVDFQGLCVETNIPEEWEKE